MGDEGEFWKDVRPELKKRSRVARGKNRKQGAQALKLNRIPFLSKNFGAHLIVCPDDVKLRVDYWPGTGLWRSYGGLTEGRGIESLLRYLKQPAEASNG